MRIFIYWTGLTIAITGVLAHICGNSVRARIAEDLETRTLAALEEDGIKVSVSALAGRDVTLTGRVVTGEVKRRAVATASEVFGVRRVHDSLRVIEAHLLSNRLRVSRRGISVTVQGTVADQRQYERVSNDASEIFGLDNVTNELQIVDHSRPSWVDVFPIVSQPLLTEIEDGTLEISGERIVIDGVVASSSTRTMVETELRDQFPSLVLESRIEVKPPSEIEARIRGVLETRRIEFESNGARLTPAGRRTLDRVAGILREHPRAEIEISGHTDDRGEPSYNLSLSQRRADSVRNHLADLVEVNGFSTVGYGAERPVASNRTAEGRQRNRRIEFRVLREN